MQREKMQISENLTRVLDCKRELATAEKEQADLLNSFIKPEYREFFDSKLLKINVDYRKLTKETNF